MGPGDRGVKGSEFRPRRPLVAAAFFFSLGIGLGSWLPAFSGWWVLAATAASLLTWGAASAAGLARSGSWAGVLTFLLLGLVRFQAEDVSPAASWSGGPMGGEVVVAGRVTRPSESRGAFQVVELEEVRVRSPEGTFRSRQEVQLYLRDVEGEFSSGERLLVRGRMSPIRGDRNLAWFPRPVDPKRRRLAARVYVWSPVWVKKLGRELEDGIGPAITRMREGAIRFWERQGNSAAVVLKALTTGQRSGITEKVRQDFYRSGLAHLLAVSGLHLGFLALFLYLFFRKTLAAVEPLVLRYPVHRLAAAATIPFLWFFYLFSGEQISAGRAAIMTGLGLIAVITFRRTDPRNLVALAVLLMLAMEPLLLFSISFQLSFAAVIVLVRVVERLRPPVEADPPRRGRRALAYFKGLGIVSLAATAGTMPLVAYHFQRLAVVGPVANLVAVPLTGFLVLPLAWLAVLVQGLWPPAGEVLGVPALMATSLLLKVAEFFASWSWSSFWVPRPPPALVLSLLGLVVAVLRPWRGWRDGWPAAVALAAVLFSGGWWHLSRHGEEIRAAFLDVGQGEAVLVRLPGGKSLLVDTGPDWDEGDAGHTIVAPALRKLGVSRIDYLALTHLHPDHSGGLASLLEEFPVGEIWSSRFGWEDCPPEISIPIREWEKRGGRLRYYYRGEEWRGDGGVQITFLNPPRNFYRDPGGNIHRDMNDNSLAFSLSWKGLRLVMTGDIGPRPVREIGSLLAPGEATTVLKVPHHGGRQEGTRDLAGALRPRYAMISVGRNRYGHPDPEVVSAFGEVGEVFRTDRDGGIFLRSSGGDIKAWTWRRLVESRTFGERLRWFLEGW